MKTNKLFILFLILVFLLSGIVYADDIDLEIDSSIETISPQDTIPSINSRAAIVYDRNSGMILYGKNENEKRYIFLQINNKISPKNRIKNQKDIA